MVDCFVLYMTTTSTTNLSRWDKTNTCQHGCYVSMRWVKEHEKKRVKKDTFIYLSPLRIQCITPWISNEDRTIIVPYSTNELLSNFSSEKENNNMKDILLIYKILYDFYRLFDNSNRIRKWSPTKEFAEYFYPTNISFSPRYFAPNKL